MKVGLGYKKLGKKRISPRHVEACLAYASTVAVKRVVLFSFLQAVRRPNFSSQKCFLLATLKLDVAGGSVHSQLHQVDWDLLS